MLGMLHPVLKSRWLAMVVHGGLWLLLLLGLTSFHGTSPYYHDTDVFRGQPQVLPPVTHLGEAVFTAGHGPAHHQNKRQQSFLHPVFRAGPRARSATAAHHAEDRNYLPRVL